jgi:hypothetical protein
MRKAIHEDARLPAGVHPLSKLNRIFVEVEAVSAHYRAQ